MSYNNERGYSNMDAPYSNQAFSSSAWLEKEQARNRRSKWLVIGALVGVIALVAVGVAVGVTVAKNKSNNSSSSSSNSGVVKSDPNDPSIFEKDDRLRQSFYALAYTPENSLFPYCGNSLEAVITDIQVCDTPLVLVIMRSLIRRPQLISQLTNQIRLYGADCNQTALVLEAIQRTKVDMQVWLGNYPIPSDPEPYQRQRDAIIEAIQTYGTDHIAGITVGNEYILNWLGANDAEDPNSAIGNVGAQMLLSNITDTRNAIAALNLDKTIPIGTADAGSFFNTQVLQSVDFGMSNIHAWFANVSASEAAGWVTDFFQTENLDVAATLPNRPQMFIAETGWPTASKDAGNESNGVSLASEENLQIFLDTFVCQSNAAGIGYFYFEFTDEVWKDEQFGGVEGHWGLFYSNRTLKNINIPTCS
ncbi:glycoside hydrolase [Earliella scabrosa]|nr:glycoside hydrolase [Earliella scabrosa]